MTARPFVMVYPDEVRAHGAEPALVLRYLAYRTQDTDGVVLSHEAVADGTGLTVRAVRRIAAVLRSRGLIETERADTWDPTLRWHVSAGRAVSTDSVTTSCPEQSPVMTPAVTSLVTPAVITPLPEESIEEPPPSPPPAASPDGDEQTFLPVLVAVPDRGPDYEEEFTGFWGAWPAGRKVGKPTAFRAYVKARKSGTPVEAIAAGLRAHLPAWTARIDVGEAGFVPHPTTWLNRAGWEDTPPPMPRVARGPRNVLLDPHLMDSLGSAIGFAGGAR